jgi:transcriptional regulator with XRE-family HTH domain
MEKPRHKLRAARYARGLSQSELAKKIGVTRGIISDWECGKVNPYPYHVGKLCSFFGVKDPAELDLVNPPDQQRAEDCSAGFSSDGQAERIDVSSPSKEPKKNHTLDSGIASMKEDRRNFLQGTLNLAGSLVALQTFMKEMASLEQLTEIVISSSKIDSFMVTQLETITRSHWYLFLHVPSKGDLLNSFWEHLQIILRFIRHSQPGAIRNRLYSIAGESAQMIGEIFFDMQEYQYAQNYYDFSIFAAKEAGNNALRAVGLGRLSFLPIYRNEPLQAYPLLEEAKQLLSSASQSMISSWLAVVEAEVAAHLHDEVACEKALERAIIHYHPEGPEEEKLWTRLNAATIPGYQGACYLQLQQPHKALVALQDTLTCVPDYSPRHRSLILADMAAAMQQMEEIKEACTLLQDTLEITMQTKSLMVLSRMQQVRKNLEPWKGTSYVKQLDASINQILPGIMV